MIHVICSKIKRNYNQRENDSRYCVTQSSKNLMLCQHDVIFINLLHQTCSKPACIYKMELLEK